MNQRYGLFIRLALVVQAILLLTGCARVGGVSATPTSTAVPPTAKPSETSAPAATSTPTPLPTETQTPTPIPSPTVDKRATLAAKETATQEAILAVAKPFLEKNGIDTAQGHIVFYKKDAVRSELTSYMETSNYVLKDAGKLTDFVVQTKVEWNTSGALSLCGITFHAEDDLEKGEQNRFFIMRLQFDPGWTIWHWKNGQFQNFVSDRWLPSRDIHDENDDKNVITLVVQGKGIDVYINGDKQRRVEDAVLKDGLLALSAYQESGRTVCKFTDTWVWAFEP